MSQNDGKESPWLGLFKDLAESVVTKPPVTTDDLHANAKKHEENLEKAKQAFGEIARSSRDALLKAVDELQKTRDKESNDA